MLVLGHNTLDYTFAEAPVDWIEQGTWMETTRWSCSPQWSFLAGWSRGDAVLWHKQRIAGDQSLEAFVGPKMEYPRERDVYAGHYRDFAVTLCSDGHDPRSGYAAIYGATDSRGQERDKRTVLLRNGVEVASTGLSVPMAHRHWFSVELRKKGATVEFWVEGKAVLSYTDPHPLDGGVPAIWSTDNALCVALAQLHFTQPPQPRQEPQVILDSPWFPVWSNVNTPLTLDFPGTWPTSGKPVSLTVTKQMAPEGEEGAVAVQGKRITYTPQKAGEYWYEIRATDGAAQSLPFHLFGRSFAPALGRDDSHALVLYRFTEGAGNIVHDIGKVGPPADLSILNDSTSSGTPFWQPVQGLTMRGANGLKTEHGVSKLMAIAKARACTLECWVAADTIYTREVPAACSPGR